MRRHIFIFTYANTILYRTHYQLQIPSAGGAEVSGAELMGGPSGGHFPGSLWHLLSLLPKPCSEAILLTGHAQAFFPVRDKLSECEEAFQKPSCSENSAFQQIKQMPPSAWQVARTRFLLHNWSGPEVNHHFNIFHSHQPEAFSCRCLSLSTYHSIKNAHQSLRFGGQ